MHSLLLSLVSVDDVKAFCAAAATLPCEVDARCGRYVVNGKSIMGLFSMDLSRPIEVTVRGDDAHFEALNRACAAFVVSK